MAEEITTPIEDKAVCSLFSTKEVVMGKVSILIDIGKVSILIDIGKYR